MKFKGIDIINIKNTGHTTIDWILGNYCNFKCSYCFGDLNTGTFRVPKINSVIENNIKHLVSELHSIGKKKISFTLAGGEPTMYHDFNQLTTLLKSFGPVGIITNGARTLDWWKNNHKTLDKVSISYHVEFADLSHTLDLIELLLNNSDLFVAVHVMMHDKMFEKSIEAAETFSEKFQNRDNVKIELKLLRKADGSVVDYTSEQLEKINSFKFLFGIKTTPHHGHISTYLLEDNTTHRLSPRDIKDLSGSFKGYDCFAPQEFLQINQYGNIGEMSCGQSYNTTCNIYSEDFLEKFKIPKNSVICEKDICGCLGLLYSSKNKTTNKV